jgi:hypothetical protein
MIKLNAVVLLMIPIKWGRTLVQLPKGNLLGSDNKPATANGIAIEITLMIKLFFGDLVNVNIFYSVV